MIGQGDSRAKIERPRRYGEYCQGDRITYDNTDYNYYGEAIITDATIDGMVAVVLRVSNGPNINRFVVMLKETFLAGVTSQTFPE